MTNEKQVDYYKGFSLFNDIEDTALRNRNRAVVMANIAEDNIRDRMISPKGSALILGYFDQIPMSQRADVNERFVKAMDERGLSVA